MYMSIHVYIVIYRYISTYMAIWILLTTTLWSMCLRQGLLTWRVSPMSFGSLLVRLELSQTST